uniref:RNA helicase n=1 Tax=Tetradesmus obliquus TaxID=3088 RepID=A0A383WFR0_TETOB|eukprot:jgi/Sobl393_1/19381/SZX76103.1
MPTSDEDIAARLLSLFQLLQPGPEGIEVRHAASALSCNIGALQNAVRRRPTEFALYNNNKLRKRFIVCFLYCTGAARASAATNGDAAANDLYCSTCNMAFNSIGNLQSHLRSSRHRVTLLAEQLRSSGSMHANQQGICISELPEGQVVQVGQSTTLQMTVDNVGSSSQLLLRVYQLRPLPEVSLLPDLPLEGWRLHAGESLALQLEVAPRHGGILCSLVVFEFQRFVIARELRSEADPFFGDTTLPDISASSPYTKQRRRVPRAPAAAFEPGEKERRTKAAWQKPPRDHKVPARLRQLVADGNAEQLQQELEQFRGRTDVASHLSKLHLLLHLEELQQESDVRAYDIEAAMLTPGGNGRLLALKVPGLAEARPSVMRGDALYVTKAGDSSMEYQGIVHMVQMEQVLLRFSQRFHSTVYLPKLPFNVRFSIKRTGFVFMHEALDVAQRGLVAGARPELLLPPPDAMAVPGNGVQVSHWFDRKVASNPEQRTAVQNIVAGSSGRLPFIIWGPPGTGKTSTLVEAAAQVLKLLPSSRLLLVAPSNLAADLLAQRLLAAGRPKSEMLRICAFARPKEDLPPELLEVTCWDDAECAFKLPALAEVTASRKRVVVVTALMAGKLHALGVPAGHFSHIMFDEAGHAEEPLALCALAGLSGATTSVVLAGDPKQLGPVIHSRIAGEAGLRLSLLERLAGSAPYSAAEQHPTAAAGLIVKLVRNYRSHPELLEVPSRLFYSGQLAACASHEITHTLLYWERLGGRPMPLLFHSIVGKDEREGNSPSWFNTQECKQVLQYVQELRALRRNPVAASQIAVITPYRKQVQKIRTYLEAKGHGSVLVGSVQQLQGQERRIMVAAADLSRNIAALPYCSAACSPALQVGSVEQLQGQERRVVIISTVRSQPSYLEHDAKHRLGFVGNAKRFNVAVTRAQALLIVVGNPAILMQDPNWLALLLSCQQRGATAGQPMPDLNDAAARASYGAANGANDGSSSSSNGGVVGLLERLMSSLTLGDAGAAGGVAAAEFGLQDLSGLVGEAGAGMVRHE